MRLDLDAIIESGNVKLIDGEEAVQVPSGKERRSQQTAWMSGALMDGSRSPRTIAAIHRGRERLN